MIPGATEIGPVVHHAGTTIQPFIENGGLTFWGWALVIWLVVK